MNTCAECRFWKDIDVEHRGFHGTMEPKPNVKECRRLREDGAAAYVIAQGSDDDALMTRGDFGCVQFEKRPVDLKGIPVGGVTLGTASIRTGQGGVGVRRPV